LKLWYQKSCSKVSGAGYSSRYSLFAQIRKEASDNISERLACSHDPKISVCSE
jgi:hypothetical protein